MDEVDRVDAAKKMRNALPLQFITHHSSFIVSSVGRKILTWILLLLPFCGWASEPVHTIREIDRYGYFLTLEDGSVWQINWWNAWNSWHWKRGEQLQILEEQQAKLLLNLDQPEKKARVFAQLCPSLEKVKNRHFVAEILENETLIKLENGFVFTVAWPGNAEIQAEMKQWRVGDELLLNAWYETGGGGFIAYLLENTTRYSEVPVRFIETQGAYTTHRIKEISWNSITLEDGSRWEPTRFEDAIKTWGWWNAGDPVMIFLKHRQELNDYILINCNALPREGRFVYVREVH